MGGSTPPLSTATDSGSAAVPHLGPTPPWRCSSRGCAAEDFGGRSPTTGRRRCSRRCEAGCGHAGFSDLAGVRSPGTLAILTQILLQQQHLLQKSNRLLHSQQELTVPRLKTYLFAHETLNPKPYTLNPNSSDLGFRVSETPRNPRWQLPPSSSALHRANLGSLPLPCYLSGICFFVFLDTFFWGSGFLDMGGC